MATEESLRLIPLVTAIRWATTAVSLLLLSTGDPSGREAAIGAGVLSYALWRTIRPLEFSGPSRTELWAVLAEGVVMTTAVATTGSWDSPYVFGLVTVIAAAGFSGGIPMALQATAACAVAVAVPYHLGDADPSAQLTMQWAAELALVALLAGYVRRLSVQARAVSSRYAGRLRQLSEVNGLLLQLRRVAHTLPMSLDLAETLDSMGSRLHDLFRPDALVILLRDGDNWSVVRCSGLQLTREQTGPGLPPVLQRAMDAPAPVLKVRPEDTNVARLDPGAGAGLYARLAARQELVGLVAVERRGADPFTDHDVVVMDELCQQMAIAVDNARWFSQIGMLAAEQERSRIARDLHDRVGQSLALVGFELDRVVRTGAGSEVGRQLVELRETVRSVVGELRETLHDLRTDVSEERDLVAALEEFLGRVRARSGLEVTLEHHSTRRLALTVEREVWRIAQEAVFNAERHASARSISVSWRDDEHGAELLVIDDGMGMPAFDAGRRAGYGLLGMQERAQAIDAALELSSSPGGGTRVQLRLRR